MKTARLKKSSPAQTWYLVTNHLNLLYMMAAGLVMEPAGFRGKYYRDSLRLSPGWIPLFANTIPANALDDAVRERKHLRPCIVSVDLSGVSAPAQVFSRDGKIRDANFPNLRLGKSGMGILLPAPLPLTLFARIYFDSDEDRQTLETAAKDSSNVDLQPYRLTVDSSLFRNAADVAWPPTHISNGLQKKGRRKVDNRQRELPWDETDIQDDSESPVGHLQISEQALGGLLAMLYHCANRSERGVKVFQRITSTEQAADAGSIQDPILAELPKWLNDGGVSEHANTAIKLFWGVVQALAMEENSLADPVDTLLSFLDAQLLQMPDGKDKSDLDGLIKDMRSVLGLGAGTITELFERNRGSLSRPLLLFCLRKECRDLLEFSHPLLGAEEYLLSGILFGVRDGWLRLPCEMRAQELAAYVMSRMTDLAHRKQGDVFACPKTPSPYPLRTLFPAEGEAWHPGQIKVAIKIAKVRKWQISIETIISSADGSPLDEPRQQRGKFIFSGETTSAITIDHKLFLQHLGEWPPLERELENEARNKLNSIRREGVE